MALFLDLLVLSGDVLSYLDRHGSSILPSAFLLPFATMQDGSIAELYGHLKLLVAVVALVLVWRATRAGVYGAWALIFTTIVADDYFRIHEQVGKVLATTLSLPAVADLRPQDLGELLVWATAGIVGGALLVITHLRAGARGRRDSWFLAATVVILALFAVALDMAAVVIQHLTGHSPLTSLTDYVESAGELVTMTVMMFVALAIWARQRSVPDGAPAQ